MEFSINTIRPDLAQCDCIVVGIFEDGSLTKSAAIVDRQSKGKVRSLIKSGDINGKLASCRLLFDIPGIKVNRVLVVGLGTKDSCTEQQWRKIIIATVRALSDTKVISAVAYCTEFPVSRKTGAWKAKTFVVLANETLYSFDRLKSQKGKRPVLAHLAIGAPGSTDPRLAAEMKEGVAVAEGMKFAKDLANLPGNFCTPTHLANQAVKLGGSSGIQVEVLEQAEMKKIGMGALLAVSRGSREPPKFIIAKYLRGAKKSAPIVLIGKGITFDSGGISLKPGLGMDEMKFDMCGAASVLGTMIAISRLGLKLNVIGLIPATENMPDGAANKPGDVITSLSGKTIEVLNTDAEGRLILCDALTYAEQLKPELVIDIATLTGACVIALGHVNSGLFSNDEQLAADLVSAGLIAADPAWLMPMSEEYDDELKSNFADFANVGGRAAGSITAAAFLSKFAGTFRWAHLDIAGTAWRTGPAKGATGRPIPLLVEFLIKQSRASIKHA